MTSVTFETVLQVLEKTLGSLLTEDERAILLGTWEGQEYQQIAKFSNYSESYLKRNLAPLLWQRLSEAFDQQINKRNFRVILEKQCIKPSIKRRILKQKKLHELRSARQALTNEQLEKLKELKLPEMNKKGKDLALAINTYELIRDSNTQLSGQEVLSAIDKALEDDQLRKLETLQWSQKSDKDSDSTLKNNQLPNT
jgi:hypothetical protein